jgi:transcriptional antiterminator
MIRVIATHFDAPGYVGSFKTTVQLSQPKLDDIKRYVEEIVKPELPSKYECIIKIEGLEISPENEQTINLKVTWTEKNDIYPAQMLCKSYSSSFGLCINMFSL